MNTTNKNKLINLLTKNNYSEFVKELSDLCLEMVGHKLLTLMKIDSSENTVRRIYTTDHLHYPEGGYKPIPENVWTEMVLVNQQSFLAVNIEEISKVFFDYELIESLGLGSAVNVPIICFGKVLGTVNLLHEEDFYDQDSIEQLQQLMPWFVIALVGVFDEQNDIGDKC